MLDHKEHLDNLRSLREYEVFCGRTKNVRTIDYLISSLEKEETVEVVISPGTDKEEKILVMKARKLNPDGTETLTIVKRNSPQEELRVNSRSNGKTIEALLLFLQIGKLGKPAIYATFEGNFLSPKAVENTLKGYKNRVREMIKGMIDKELEKRKKGERML